MDNSHCIQAYAHDYVSDRSDVLLIAADKDPTSTPALFATADVGTNNNDGCGDTYPWICPSSDCSDPCQSHLHEVLADASHWKPRLGRYYEAEADFEVEFCLSQQTPGHCKLQFSLQLVIVVLFINTLKMILMLYVVFGLHETPLMTIGDAIASFLNNEDSTTKGCCLVSKFDIKVNKLRWQCREGESNEPLAKAWSPRKVPWARAVSRTRWCVCGAMLVLPQPCP